MSSTGPLRNVLKEQYAYVSGLDRETRQAIEDYTGSSYGILNRRLMRGEWEGSYYEDIARLLDDAFYEAPPVTTPFMVYRGIDSDEFIRDIRAFVSTSLDVEEATRRAGRRCCLLRITVMPGSRVLPIESVSEHADEAEVLLPRVGRFEVTSESQQGNLTVYDLAYIPEFSVPVVPSITVKEVHRRLGEEEWVERLVHMAREEMEDFGSDASEAVGAVVNTMYASEVVPPNAISVAIARLDG